MNDMTKIEQGTPEWHAMRLGRVTASRISDVLAKGRSGAPSATRNKYLGELVAERLTGEPVDGFTNAAMDHGTETEPRARAAYEWHVGFDVVELSFSEHPQIDMAGASPDGLVGDDGLVEIKCPNTSTHIGYLLGGTLPKKYRDQMQWQMACTGRAWCDFVSFDPRLPADAGQFYLERFEADREMIIHMESEVRAFLAEVDATIKAIRNKFGTSDES